jgi:riboflavin kinase/FMN adenylyltransferase
MTAAVTPGNHDGVHVGHRALVDATLRLKRARGLDAVALFFDPHPALVVAPERAPRPLTTPKRREELLRGAGADRVVRQPFDRELASMSPESFVDHVLIGRERASAVVVGPDFGFGRGRTGDVDVLRALGADRDLEVVVVEPVERNGVRVSSTEIRGLLRAGEVAAAAGALARYHDVDGTVVAGDGRGRAIGFPTANLDCDEVVLPADGVYAVVARRIDRAGARLAGVANLGVRPTVAAGRAVETHLFDFDADLYGERLRLAFVARLREERKFDDLGALEAQIALDVEAARAAVGAAEEELLRWL